MTTSSNTSSIMSCTSATPSQVDGLPKSSEASMPLSSLPPATLSPLSPGSSTLFPLVRRPSCLSRTLSTRSTSSTSSNASNRSVRFCEEKPKVKYTYPKEVYDRAPIEVDENLALKRCREMQDHDNVHNVEPIDTVCPTEWATDCFYASTEEAGTTISTASDSLPNLTMSDSSVSSCSDDCDSDDSASEGTYYSPTPSQILSRGSLDDHGRNYFFDEPVVKHQLVTSPVSSAPRVLGSPSSPAVPNFLRWDKEEPGLVPERPFVVKASVHKDQLADLERRKQLRKKMQERSKSQENDWDSCLGGF